MKNRSLTIEDALYALIILLAVMARLVKLGGVALSDFEAAAAFRAFEIAQGTASGAGHYPGYVLLTGFVFYLLGSSEFLARFLPALLGSLLVFAPYLYREQLGRKTALLLALGLALDPGTVALSRLAASPILALVFTLFGLLAWKKGWQVAAGVMAALALLSGPDFWLGALGLVFAMIAWKAFSVGGDDQPTRQPLWVENRTALLALGATLVLVGTFFMRYPPGLGAFGASFLVFLQGWVEFGDVPIYVFLIGLVGYQLFILSFGIYGYLKHRSDPIVRFAGFWALAALLVALLYPARQVGDLIWVAVPLWVLTAKGIAAYFKWDRLEDIPTLILAAAIFIAQVVLLMSLSALSRVGVQSAEFPIRALVMVAAILLIVLLTVFANLGWSDKVSSRGFVWGISLGYLMLMISGAWQVLPRPAIHQQSLWHPGTGAGQTALLERSLSKLAEWGRGESLGLAITVTHDTPSLRWALRDYPHARFGDVSLVDALPEVILTYGDKTELNLAASYQGQDLVLRTYPGWAVFNAQDWITWFVYRTAPAGVENIIMWVRVDQFPGASDVVLQNLLEEFDPEEEEQAPVDPVQEEDLDGENLPVE